MNSSLKYYTEIISKLEALNKKEFLLIISDGLIKAATLSILLFFLLSLFELLGNFSSSVRTGIFFVFIISFIGLLSLYVLIPLLRLLKLIGKRDYNKTAKKVGSHFPELTDDLVNAMQLTASVDSVAIYSPSLINGAFKTVYEKTKPISFNSIINFFILKKQLYFLFLIIIVSFLFVFLLPGFSSASSRLIHFNSEFIPPARFQIEVIPGDAEITKGESVELIVKVIGGNPEKVFLKLKSDDETSYNDKLLELDSISVYRYIKTNIRTSFSYYISADEVDSEIFRIAVVDRPIIKTISFKIIPPLYSGLPSFEQNENGNVVGLPGTRINLSLTSTKDLSSARLEFSDTSQIILKVLGKRASGSFTIKKESSYTIIIEDEIGNTNLLPINYTIKTLLDAHPEIDVLNPNKDINLGNDNRVALGLKIRDDYGFSKLILNYRLSSSQYEAPQSEYSKIEIPINKTQKENDVNYIWNLSQLSPAVNDVFLYYLEVFDNDVISGPKSARTSLFNIRVPSLDEILTKADNVQNEAADELSKTLKEAEDLKKNLEKIDKELKQDKRELSWDEKEKLEEALDKFEELSNRADQIKENLQKMQQELQKNNLLSQETLEKYMELQELMSEITSDEMKKAMEQLRQMLDQMNRKSAQDALENFKMDEEKFKKSIERTLNLLKRLQAEQKLDELMKRTEQISEEQKEISEETKNSDMSDKKNSEKLSKKQDEITKKMEQLSDKSEDLSEKMDDIQDAPSEEMKKLIEELKKQMNEKLSEQASESMKQNKKQNAQQNQQKLSENMQQMMDMLKQMKDQMMMQNQMKVFTDMMRILDNLLELSKQQEELKKTSERIDPKSSQFNQNTQKQNDLKKNLNRLLEQLSELSQKTFAISPEMGKAMGEANQKMEMSLQAMQNRNGGFAAMNQGEAMKHLNEAASMIKSSMESMMQGGGSGGMMSLMQQLQKMSGQQMDLNNLTQQLQQMMQGNLNPQQQGEMQRLAQQQEMIRKSLDELNREAKTSGESKKIPADLENVVRQMQEVIADMKTERLNDDLIQKQERILSKLLDAQKSINERDFEKERKSESGNNLVRQSPTEFSRRESQLNKIRDELNRAVNEGYRKDYEELIRKYFEALQDKSESR